MQTGTAAMTMIGKGARLTALLAVVLLAACDQEQEAAGPPPQQPPPPVDVANPLIKEVIEWDEFTGRFEATERVELRARVSGYLDKVHFRDGQIVKKGDLLFNIDARPFQAELARARAELQSTEAALDLAEKELSRAEQLLRSRTVSQDRVDDRLADKLAAEAAVAAARAVVRAAELDVAFTTIRAPIAGRISDRKVDVGNLVSGGDARSDPLASIVALDPIFFVFDVSEADYLKYSRLDISGKRPSSRGSPNPVYVRVLDETEWTRPGKMNFVDNSFNPGSGTIRGRAVFDNPELILVPGLFGRLRLVASGAYDATLLPDAAILSDQSNKVVFVVDAEGTVAPRQVELGPIIDGLRVIRSGVGADDRVIVSGVQRAQPGGKVTANETTIPADGG